jgi:amino acid transporter/GNAT superfamily N-acetyltransferase
MRRPPGQADAVSVVLARNRLGVTLVTFFVLASMGPLLVTAGLVPQAFATASLTGVPAAFLAVALVLAVFSVGYIAMAQRIPNTGAFYAFIARGLGRPTGVGAALVALVAYNAMQVALYGALGATAAGYAADNLHQHHPWWVFALGFWLIILVLGLAQVRVSSMLLGVLCAGEILMLLTVAANGLLHPAERHVSLAALSPTSLRLGPTLGALIAIAVLAFVGFEQAVVFSEEARDRRRTVPRATYLALVGLSVLYTLASWAMLVHYGPQTVTVAQNQGPLMLFAMAPGLVGSLGRTLFLTALFAAALAFHNAVWRYTFALGREHVLPARLAKTTAGIPRSASVAQSVLALGVIFLAVLYHWEPMGQLFFWAGTAGGYGVLLLLATTSLAIIAFFARTPAGTSPWQRWIAPGLSATALWLMAYLATRNFATLLGVPGGTPATIWLPALFPLAFLIGVAGADPARGQSRSVRRDRIRPSDHPNPNRDRACRPARAHHRKKPPMTKHHSIVAAEPGDAQKLSTVVAAAFHPLAPCQWLIPHAIQRRVALPAYFRILVDHALSRGIVETTLDRTAAALWLPVGPDGPEVPDRYEQRLKDAVGPHLERFEILDDQFEQHHSTGIPHQHLAILAVHPDHQHQGIGRALLAHRHQVLDAERTPAYLEASDKTNRDWYARQGYCDIGDEIRLPDGPLMWPMWREPSGE